MKILYFSQLFTHTAGGGERVFREYARYFSEQGNNVSVVCQLSNLADNTPNNVQIYQVPPHLSGFLPKTMDSVLFFLKGIPIGLKVISTNKIQLIHSNNFLPMLIGSAVSKITGVSHISTLHHIFTTSRMKITRPVSRSVSFSFLTPIKQAVLSVSLKLSNPKLILVPSKKSLDDIRSMGYKGPVSIIPNGVAMPENKNIMNVNPNFLESYFLFLGRHVFYKNLDTVIKAFKIVTAKNPEANLIVTGDGPMCDKWKSLVNEFNLKENIKFVGFIGEKEKERLLINCIALIFPSVVEGFGLTILEAFAMAKPVLVADIEPVNELVESGSDGYKIVHYYDEQEWAEKFFFLLNSPQRTIEMGRNGRQKVIDAYLEIRVFERIQGLYEQTLQEKSGHA